VGDDALTDRLRTAVHDRFVTVNGDHPMTAADDAYAREHFVPATPEAMALMLEGRLPLPSYVLRDGTPVVPAAHGELAGIAGDCLVVNLPGSRGGVKDGLGVLEPVVRHAVEQVVGSDH
jgi:hypothetical protein